MNLLHLSLLLALGIGVSNFSPLQAQTSRKNPPTKLARYKTSAYLASNGDKLRINVDKQLDGEVSVQLTDAKGIVYFYQIMGPTETTLRLSLNVSELNDGEYSLKISNGLDEDVRIVKLITPDPQPTNRTITIL